MYVKRNIKIGGKVKGPTKIVEPLVRRNPRRFKSQGLGKYKFPIYDDIPAGDYYSKITSIKETITKSGKEAVEVFYEIKDGTTCYKIANGILPEDAENKPYYIKQVYPEGTQYYDDFVDSMAEALEKEDFEIDEVIGVTEYNTLSYDKGDIGGFSRRCPCEWEDLIVETSPNDNKDDLDEEYY